MRSIQFRSWRCVVALVVVGLSCVGAASWAAPETAAAPSAEFFFRDADLHESVLSPSGKLLAYTTGKGGSRVGLYVHDLEAGGTTRVAQFNNVDLGEIQWVNEERLLFMAVDYSEGSGRPDGAPGLFSIKADGSAQRELVQRYKEFVLAAGPASSRPLEWNHRLLMVPAPRDGESNEMVLIGELDFSDEKGAAPTVRPRWLNVSTGRSRAADFNPPPGVKRWMFDSRGEPRVVFTQIGAKQAAYWRGPGKSDWQLIVEGDLMGFPFTPDAVDDAGNLYVTRLEGPDGLEVLSRYDFERKAPSPEALVSTAGFDFDGQLMLERGSGAAQGVRLTTDLETTVWYDEAMKRFQATADELLPRRVNRISCRRCGQADMVALVRSYSDREPGWLLLYRAKPAEGQKPWSLVGQVREGVDERQMAKVAFERIKARDGRDLPVWLTFPTSVPAGKAVPAVVLVHGGPWVRGGHWQWQGMQQFLASRGYLVIEPEFRGSMGYGYAHFEAGWKQWGQAMQDDVADALLWARNKGLASDRACIAGASYGGYSTLMGLVRQPELYRCGAAWMAVTDLELYAKGSRSVSDDISDLSRKYTIPQMVGDVEKDAAMIAANSPVLLADKIKAPLLLAFGEADERVPLAHGKRLREALKSAGQTPEWISYEGEGHGFSIQKNRVDFALRLERFLAKYLQQ